ncbi:hypothetical protein GCM10009712_15930 [Pseudarthrobacter sulfonivorans]
MISVTINREWRPFTGRFGGFRTVALVEVFGHWRRSMNEISKYAIPMDQETIRKLQRSKGTRTGRIPGAPDRREIQFLRNSGRPWIGTFKGDLREFRRLAEYWREGYNFLRWRKAYRDDPEPITRKYRRRQDP